MKARTSVIIATATVLAASIAAIALTRHRVDTGIIPLFYLIGFAIIAAAFHKGDIKRPLLPIILAGVTGWVADAVAVRISMLFGPYQYGEALGFSLLNVPIAMVLFWMLVVYLAIAVAKPIENPTRQTVVGAGAIVLFDLLLEPSASALGLWHFYSNNITFQNYIVWFVLGFIFIRFVQKAKGTFSNSIAVPLYWIIIAFLLLLDFVVLIFK